MKIVPDYPYFISVEDRNEIDNSYYRNPINAGVDIIELDLKEEVTVQINDGGEIRNKVLFKGG